MVASRSSAIYLLRRSIPPFATRWRTTATRGIESAVLQLDKGLPTGERAGTYTEQDVLNREGNDGLKWNHQPSAYVEKRLNSASGSETSFDVSHPLSQPACKLRRDETHLINVEDAFEGFPIAHSTFRELLKLERQPKKLRTLFRAQLLQCDWPRDVFRIVACAVQHPKTLRHLSGTHDALVRAIYRCRNNTTDPKIYGVLIAIIQRFRQCNVRVDRSLIFMALKFAARSRSLSAMKKVLKLIRQDGIRFTGHGFRSVIAKFSIGRRGLGEIRNGRWKQSDLLQVLKGFDDATHLPAEEQYHLGSFLDRSDWQAFHGWIAVLARCRDSDAIWKEWEFWCENENRKNPRMSVMRAFNTRDRVDVWFVEQMTYSGDYKKAWQLLGATTVKFDALKPWVRDRLLSDTEHATMSCAQLQAELLAKHERDRVRTKMDWENCDHGFPYEDPELERPLHDAAATTGLSGL